MKNKGFTLIEIIIVIVIIGIMAALALPKITSSIDRGNLPTGLSQMGKIVREVDQCAQVMGGNDCLVLTGIGYSASPYTDGAWTYTLATTYIQGQCATTGANKCSNAGTILFSITVTNGTGVSVDTKTTSGSFQGFHFK